MSQHNHTPQPHPAINGGDLRTRCLLLSLLAAMSVLSPSEAKAQTENGNGMPKLVVNILVDQLRSDYLEAFMPLYGEDGFKRLMREGRIYSQTDYHSSHTDIASAHATVANGSSASRHGIVNRE